MAAATSGEAIRAATDALTAAGIETPRLDAEVLLAGLLNTGRADLVARPDTELDPPVSRAFSEAVRRRLKHEPVAYILGRKGFRYIELEVDRRVLVPRPETELLVELALEVEPATVLEVGTGSGAVSLALADELPECSLTATDVSSDALSVALSNSRRLGFSERIAFVSGSLPPEGGKFDLILANLPYIPDSDRLPSDVEAFEPHRALFGGPDGTDVIAEVLAALAGTGIESRVIGLEIGPGQGETVAGMLRAVGYPKTEVRPDLAGIERVAVGHRVGPGTGR
ncbi:MAG: peptide chain release factor N(5)-glutamine methyltransferase [Solirubrobacterales bacterium]|nr:peptide chain release factor N(5)-glutamine methyltransferase [Solirubrobacterales bacterium]